MQNWSQPCYLVSQRGTLLWMSGISNAFQALFRLSYKSKPHFSKEISLMNKCFVKALYFRHYNFQDIQYKYGDMGLINQSVQAFTNFKTTLSILGQKYYVFKSHKLAISLHCHYFLGHALLNLVIFSWIPICKIQGAAVWHFFMMSRQTSYICSWVVIRIC